MRFITGFTGDNGIGLVTKDIAYLWTDGRFYIQIVKELYPGWQMKKMEFGEETLTEAVKRIVPKNSKIGMDLKLFSNSK